MVAFQPNATAVLIEPGTVFRVMNTNFTVNRPMNFYQIIIGDTFIVFNNVNYTVTANESRTIFVGDPSIIKVESKTVTQNQSFVLHIYCYPNEPIKGWEFKIKFDNSYLSANFVKEGNFFDGYQTFPVMGTISNANGIITNIYNLIVGQGNISASGILVSINFTAKSEGNASIELYDVGICNETKYLTNIVNNGYVIITPEQKEIEEPIPEDQPSDDISDEPVENIPSEEHPSDELPNEVPDEQPNRHPIDILHDEDMSLLNKLIITVAIAILILSWIWVKLQ